MKTSGGSLVCQCCCCFGEATSWGEDEDGISGGRRPFLGLREKRVEFSLVTGSEK